VRPNIRLESDGTFFYTEHSIADQFAGVKRKIRYSGTSPPEHEIPMTCPR
jgi:hypothetical protein